MTEFARLSEDLRQRIEVSDSGCWLWRGTVNRAGYGVLVVNAKQWRAHRYVWHSLGLPLDEVLHHRCEVTICVNPAHLEPMSADAHRRGHHPREDRCARGHDVAKDHHWCVDHRKHGTVLRRVCNACSRERQAAYRERRKAIVDSD